MEPRPTPSTCARARRDAWPGHGLPRDLYGAPQEAQAARPTGKRRSQYPAWVLDQMGVEVMLANRVEMGPSIQPPRFRWVPYADALLFPLDNSRLAAREPRPQGVLRAGRRPARAVPGAPASGAARHAGRVPGARGDPRRSKRQQAGRGRSGEIRSRLPALAGFRPGGPRGGRPHLRRSQGSARRSRVQSRSRTTCSATSPRNAGAWVWRCTCTPWPGAGGYFDVAGANPLLLESVLDDPALRKTRFVMVHGGWPFTREIGALLTKPNAYLDFSAQALRSPGPTLAGPCASGWNTCRRR